MYLPGPFCIVCHSSSHDPPIPRREQFKRRGKGQKGGERGERGERGEFGGRREGKRGQKGGKGMREGRGLEGRGGGQKGGNKSGGGGDWGRQKGGERGGVGDGVRREGKGGGGGEGVEGGKGIRGEGVGMGVEGRGKAGGVGLGVGDWGRQKGGETEGQHRRMDEWGKYEGKNAINSSHLTNFLPQICEQWESGFKVSKLLKQKKKFVGIFRGLKRPPLLTQLSSLLKTDIPPFFAPTLSSHCLCTWRGLRRP